MPLTVTVTEPPATVPSTRASTKRSWALSSCSCICWACCSRPWRSKPPGSPEPPSDSKGFWDMGGVTCSLVGDLFDDLGAQRLLEKLRPVETLRLGIDVVVARPAVD